MPAEVDLVNRALRLLKAGRIDSINEGSKNSRVANDVFDQVRDELLRETNWPFATKRVKLARSTTDPAFEFDYAYVLPSDWIRTISVHDNDGGYGTVYYKEEQVNGKNVLCASIENCYLRYVAKVTDPNLMSEDFHAAFVYRLALAMPGISNISAAERDVLKDEARSVVNRAKSAAGMASFPDPRPRGSWADSRSGLYRGRVWPR